MLHLLTFQTQMHCNPPQKNSWEGYRNVESKINIDPFYLMLIIKHITYGIAIPYCADKLLDCFHRYH